MTNSHKAPNLRKDVNHPDNKRFFDMLSLVFNTRQEDAANKEAAGAAKITLGKLLLQGRVDLTLISDALSKQKGFRRSAFATAYVEDFMRDNATEVHTALDMMARDSVHSAEKLFEMLKADMANANGKANPNFPSMMVNTPMMKRYVDSIMALHDPENRTGTSLLCGSASCSRKAQTPCICECSRNVACNRDHFSRARIHKPVLPHDVSGDHAFS